MTHPGKRIADLRKRLGFTQAELAARSEHSRSYLARVEAGIQEPSLKFINAVATGLGIPGGLLLLSREDLTADSLYADIYDMLDKIIDTKAALANA